MENKMSVKNVRCGRCGREVFYAERKSAINKVWHTFCFSCAICRKLLDSCSVIPFHNELYCSTCFRRLNSYNSEGSPNLEKEVEPETKFQRKLKKYEQNVAENEEPTSVLNKWKKFEQKLKTNQNQWLTPINGSKKKEEEPVYCDKKCGRKMRHKNQLDEPETSERRPKLKKSMFCCEICREKWKQKIPNVEEILEDIGDEIEPKEKQSKEIPRTRQKPVDLKSDEKVQKWIQKIEEPDKADRTDAKPKIPKSKPTPKSPSKLSESMFCCEKCKKRWKQNIPNIEEILTKAFEAKTDPKEKRPSFDNGEVDKRHKKPKIPRTRDLGSDKKERMIETEEPERDLKGKRPSVDHDELDRPKIPLDKEVPEIEDPGSETDTREERHSFDRPEIPKTKRKSSDPEPDTHKKFSQTREEIESIVKEERHSFDLDSQEERKRTIDFESNISIREISNPKLLDDTKTLLLARDSLSLKAYQQLRSSLKSVDSDRRNSGRSTSSAEQEPVDFRAREARREERDAGKRKSVDFDTSTRHNSNQKWQIFEHEVIDRDIPKEAKRSSRDSNKKERKDSIRKQSVDKNEVEFKRDVKDGKQQTLRRITRGSKSKPKRDKATTTREVCDKTTTTRKRDKSELKRKPKSHDIGTISPELEKELNVVYSEEFEPESIFRGRQNPKDSVSVNEKDLEQPSTSSKPNGYQTSGNNHKSNQRSDPKETQQPTEIKRYQIQKENELPKNPVIQDRYSFSVGQQTEVSRTIGTSTPKPTYVNKSTSYTGIDKNEKKMKKDSISNDKPRRPSLLERLLQKKEEIENGNRKRSSIKDDNSLKAERKEEYVRRGSKEEKEPKDLKELKISKIKPKEKKLSTIKPEDFESSEEKKVKLKKMNLKENEKEELKHLEEVDSTSEENYPVTFGCKKYDPIERYCYSEGKCDESDSPSDGENDVKRPIFHRKDPTDKFSQCSKCGHQRLKSCRCIRSERNSSIDGSTNSEDEIQENEDIHCSDKDCYIPTPSAVSNFYGRKYLQRYCPSCFPELELDFTKEEDISGKCKRCKRKVYVMEEVKAAGGVYHDSCFTCFICRRPLDSLRSVSRRGEVYCKKCHMKFFGPQLYGYGMSPNLTS